jgi:hypothetical protein
MLVDRNGWLYQRNSVSLSWPRFGGVTELGIYFSTKGAYADAQRAAYLHEGVQDGTAQGLSVHRPRASTNAITASNIARMSLATPRLKEPPFENRAIKGMP